MQNETEKNQDLIQKDPLGGCLVIHGRNDRGRTDQRGHSYGKKWLNSGYILKQGQMLGDREKSKDDPKIHGKDGSLPFIELWKNAK